MRIGRSAYCPAGTSVAALSEALAVGAGERGDEGIQGADAAATPPPQLSLGALRRGAVGRAFAVLGLLSLVGSYLLPFALDLRFGAVETARRQNRSIAFAS